MKKKNWWKIVLLILAILACITIPITLYFTIGQNNSSPGKVNLAEETVTYHANVKFMNKISSNEPTEIKNGIETNITNKMNSLKLEINTDYTISNLDSIQDGVDLNNVDVVVNSVATSDKVTGSLDVKLTVTEDMTGRKIDQDIEIPESETDDLSALIANSTITAILHRVNEALYTGQNNEFETDYDIENLGLIKEHAVYADYATALKVVPIDKSTHLTGSFTVTFTITSGLKKL